MESYPQKKEIFPQKNQILHKNIFTTHKLDPKKLTKKGKAPTKKLTLPLKKLPTKGLNLRNNINQLYQIKITLTLKIFYKVVNNLKPFSNNCLLRESCNEFMSY